MLLNKDDTKPSNNNCLFLQMIMIKKSTADHSLGTKNKMNTTGSRDVPYILETTKSSVHSQVTAATDSSSIVSDNDDCSSLASQSMHCEQNKTVPEQGSAMKRDNCTRRPLRHNVVRVQFKPDVTQKCHLALHEYTNDELDACWLRIDEYAAIALKCRKEIRMLEHGRMKKFIESDHKYCSRGLESQTFLAGLARSQNRLSAQCAVFDEQSDQLSLGVVDVEAIASRYRDACCSSTLWAIRVGQQDQRLAELVYDNICD